MKKYKIEFTLRFDKQLQKLYDYIVFEYQNQYDALRLINAIRKKCKNLEVFPKGNVAYRGHGDIEFRFAHVGNYTIIYVVNDEKMVVTIWGANVFS